MALTFIDILILVPLAVAAFSGFRNGLLREVLGLGGVLLALFLGFRYMTEVRFWLEPYIVTEEVWLSVLAFIIIFGLVFGGMQLLIRLLEGILKAALLSVPNKLLGMCFGLFKSGLFLSLIFILLLAFEQPSEEARQSSVLYPIVVQVAPMAYDLLAHVYPNTDSFAESIEDALRRLQPD
ncbi:membrane protein required for colicin V production [Cyclonatronum proteinivorum]|uniref:Membrane protein required for colicin V production n=1 Tax=Cyclonatronum proteinivorum TaxID=1457365 RepID=A0A345UGP0_9BACT|nr:CvpA family protein [Cyclonatronum proteinivorum]AXI99641.1 membrane protein required for colicin V production [Cyclonatronum proteinivorum]